MSAVNVATVILAAVALATVLGAVIAWVYTRGGGEREVALSLKENSRSNKELTQVVGDLGGQLIRGFREVHDRIDAHDVRLAVATRDIEHLYETRLMAARRDVAYLSGEQQEPS